MCNADFKQPFQGNNGAVKQEILGKSIAVNFDFRHWKNEQNLMWLESFNA